MRRPGRKQTAADAVATFKQCDLQFFAGAFPVRELSPGQARVEQPPPRINAPDPAAYDRDIDIRQRVHDVLHLSRKFFANRARSNMAAPLSCLCSPKLPAAARSLHR